MGNEPERWGGTMYVADNSSSEKKSRRLGRLCLGLLGTAVALGVATPRTALPQAPPPPPYPETQLFAEDPNGTDEFGNPVAISGDTVVVGAIWDDEAALDAGAAYVFVRDGTGWTQQAKLLAPDPAERDWFGWAVAISGNTIVVGTPAHTPPGGSRWTGGVYVFERTGETWSKGDELRSSNFGPGTEFGWAVALSGNTLVAGSTGDSCGGANTAGTVYVFERTGEAWTEQAKLCGTVIAPNIGFGGSLATDGETILATAQLDNTPVEVFVREGTGWTWVDSLTGSDTALDDLFGQSMSISGDTALIGANGHDPIVDPNEPPVGAGGAAYVFERNGTTWIEVTKLTDPDPIFRGQFGSSVALRNDVAVVGAPLGGDGSGKAYVFRRGGTGWTEGALVIGSGVSAGHEFGTSVAVEEGAFVVGAPSVAGRPLEIGSAYVYELPTPSSDPIELLEDLIPEVTALELPLWIERVLTRRLERASRVLSDLDERNDIFAIWRLRVFVGFVGILRGLLIPEEAADALIAAALDIIAILVEAG